MLKAIPHIITLCNLLAGSLAVFFAINGDPVTAALLILLAAFFDFFDGFAARLLGVSGDLGKQLDSLADVISFGLAPAWIAVGMLIQEEQFGVWRFVPLVMAAFSALRLGKFNIDERQTTGFIGLPTPANALFWLSIPLSVWQYERGFFWNQWAADWAGVLGDFADSIPAVVIASMVLSVMMIAEFPLTSLKFGAGGFKGNADKWILILSGVILFLVLGFGALPIVLLLYITISIIKRQYGVHSRN